MHCINIKWMHCILYAQSLIWQRHCRFISLEITLNPNSMVNIEFYNLLLLVVKLQL